MSVCAARRSNGSATAIGLNHIQNTYMKTKALIALALVSITLPSARAQLIVEDVASIAQDAINQVVDLGKYIEMVNNQVQQINTMTQELQQVTAYVQAFGDPSRILEVTGATELIDSLQQSGVGQTIGALQQTASGVEALRNNAEGLYQSIGNIQIGNVELPRNADLYKKFSALENAAENYSTVYEDGVQKGKIYRGRIAETTTALQAASTDAEAQKLQGVITGQSAQLEAIQGEVANAATTVITQDILNRNDAEKQEQAKIEADTAEWAQATKGFDGVLTLPGRRQR